VSPGYRVASGLVVFLLVLVLAASHYGWGLRRDPSVLGQGSLRSGSLHQRHHVGGGLGYGK
jgi:hypothetical protein